MRVVTKEFLNENQFVKYPVDERATFEPYSQSNLNQVNSILTDCKITVPFDVIGSVFISSINITSKLVTVTFMGVKGNPFASINFTSATYSEPTYDALEAIAIATVQVTVKSVNNTKPVAITPLIDGVGGWVCFGEGVKTPGVWSFNSPSSAKLDDRVVFRYKRNNIKTIGIKDFITQLDGKVTLAGANGLAVTSLGQHLHLGFAGSTAQIKDYLSSYIGSCGVRPESGNCQLTPIRNINGIVPDANGVLTLEFDKSMPITVLDDSYLEVSTNVAIEDLCIRAAPPEYSCDSPNLLTAGQTTEAVSTVNPDSYMTLEICSADKFYKYTNIYKYISQHPHRAATAVFSLVQGGTTATEAANELQLDMVAKLWQLYGSAGSLNPSLNFYGALDRNLHSFKTITVNDITYTVLLGYTFSLDLNNVSTIALSAVTGAIPEAYTGNYVRESYGKYVNGPYRLELKTDGTTETWSLIVSDKIAASGAIHYGEELLGTATIASAVNNELTVISLRVG